MDYLLNIYLSNKNWIELIKDAVFFAGAYTFFHAAYLFFVYLKNKQFTDISTAIEQNLHFRERLEPLLDKFIIETAKNTKDIAIRFVYWKNYPYNLESDGYKHYPWVRHFDDSTVQCGWIDNTGVNFENHVWSFGYSVYIDKHGIFFSAPEGQDFEGFREFQNTVLIFHLPYTNIVNFDFRQFIEYEPVFYTRYPYTKQKKLYDNHIVVMNRQGYGYLNIDLSQKNMIRKFTWYRYRWLILKLMVSSVFTNNKK